MENIYNRISRLHPNLTGMVVTKMETHPAGGGIYRIEVSDSADLDHLYKYDTAMDMIAEVTEEELLDEAIQKSIGDDISEVIIRYDTESDSI